MKSFEITPEENKILKVHDKKHNYFFGGIFSNGGIKVIDHDNQTESREIITDLRGLEYDELIQ